MTEPILEGRTAVVTGGSRGIGLAVAESLAQAGARVVVLDLDRPDEKVTTSDIHFVEGSVTDEVDVRQAIAVATEGTNLLDIMVCNAGFLKYESFTELSRETWQSHVDVDLTGVFVSAQEAARAMRPASGERKSTASIVVVTSISAEMPSRTQGHYASVKAGAQMLSQAMAWELGEHGIRVNSVGPGWVETRLTSDYLTDHRSRCEIEATIPLGRVGQPADIANAVLFLASDKSSYVTGAHLRVDGGLIIGKDKT